MKKVIYTVIVGDYDIIKPPLVKNSNWKYIVLKNNHSISDLNGWDEVIDFNDDKIIDPRILSRKPKILPHYYLSNFNYSIYHDANIQINYNPDVLFNLYKKFDMALGAHPGRNCVYKECLRCKEIGKDSIENIVRMENFLRMNNFPRKNGLTSNGVLFRWNNNKVNELMEYWWQFIENFTYRDQLSLGYAISQYPNIKIKINSKALYSNGSFKKNSHL